MGDLLLARAFVERHSVEAAALLETLEPEEAAALVREVEPGRAVVVLGMMAPAPAAACLAVMTPETAADLVAGIPADEVAVLLRRMPPAQADALLDALPGREAAVLRAGLGFPMHSAGACMDPRVPTLTPDTTVALAVARLRVAPSVDDEIYVVDRDQGLAGVVPARVLLVSPCEATVEDVMQHVAGRLPPQASVEVVHTHPAWARTRTLPVVADDGRFLGVVSYDVVTRLVRQTDAGRLAEASVDTFTSFSELCYVGSTRVLASLVAILTERATVPAEERP
jgi:Mg/Co/Ni transporter MgtE